MKERSLYPSQELLMKNRSLQPSRELLMKKRSLYFLCAIASSAVVIAAPIPVAAQGANVQVVPKIGISMPLGSLGDNTELANGLALGVAAELTLPRLPVNLRANLEYAHTADIVERSATESVHGEATILNLVGDVVLRPLPATATAQPYFLGGAGIKTYDIAVGPTAGPDLSRTAGTTTRFALHIGGGLDVRFGPMALVLEISDYISTLPLGDDSRTQHDVFGMIGFRVAMF
jgi:hypothetical protein